MMVSEASIATRLKMLVQTRFVAISFIIGLITSFLAIGTVMQVRFEITKSFENLRETRDFEASASQILQHVIDFETAYRGYLITAAEETLEPLRAGATSFEQAVVALERMPEHEAAFAAPVARIAELARRSSADIMAAVAAARGNSDSIAQRDSRLFAIKARVDLLRGAIAEFQTRLREQLGQRRAAMTHIVGLLLAAIVVMLTGIALSSFALLSELRRQGASARAAKLQQADTIADLSSNLTLSRSEIELVNRRLSVAIRAANATVFTIDREGNIHWTTATPESPLGENGGITSLFDRVSARSRQELRSRLDQVFAAAEPVQFDIAMEGEVGDERWLRFNILAAGENEARVLGSAIDITDIRKREAANFLLMRELSHRSKNLLAIVQAMARQTARTTQDIGAFQERFAQRLRALAASHDLLVNSNYSGAYLDEMIQSQLADLSSLIGQRITLEGPRILLQPEAAQSFGMAIHELGSNARLYGALATEEGRVEIRWHKAEEAGMPVLVVEWIEQGGPAPELAREPGFGTTLIVKSLPRALNGKVDLIHGPTGTTCRMVLDMAMMELQPGTQAASPL